MKNQSPRNKFVAVVVSLSFVFLPLPQLTNLAFASDPTEGTPTQSVPTARVVPVSNAQTSPAANVAGARNDSIDFVQEIPTIQPANPEDEPELPESINIDPAEDVTVSIQSNDFFYSRSGDWGQSYDDLWGLKAVRAPEAWNISTGISVATGKGIGIAVIDTGVDYNNAELTGKIDTAHAWNFVNNTNNARDDNGHGTHVSGIAAAKKDNGIGIAGVCPDCKILPVKVLDATGSGTIAGIINGINYVAKNAVKWGIKVINMSLGVPGSSLSSTLMSAFVKAINYANNQGVTVVAAAGNYNQDVSTFYPAALSNVISVGATDANNTRAGFSNWGSALDVMAPGVDILSLKAAGTSFGASSVVDPNYVRASGTSMAAPFVAGTVALLKARYPGLTYNDIYMALTRSAKDLGSVGFDYLYGYGLVDAYRALTTLGGSSLSTQSTGTYTTTTYSTSTSSGTGSSLAYSLNYEPTMIMESGPRILAARALGLSEGLETPRSALSMSSSFVRTPNWYRISSLRSRKRRSDGPEDYEGPRPRRAPSSLASFTSAY